MGISGFGSLSKVPLELPGVQDLGLAEAIFPCRPWPIFMGGSGRAPGKVPRVSPPAGTLGESPMLGVPRLVPWVPTGNLGTRDEGWMDTVNCTLLLFIDE